MHAGYCYAFDVILGVPRKEAAGRALRYNLLPHFDYVQCPAKGFSLQSLTQYFL